MHNFALNHTSGAIQFYLQLCMYLCQFDSLFHGFICLNCYSSLQRYLKQQINPLSEFEVLTKFSQMVDALEYIHTHNILHRQVE